MRSFDLLCVTSTGIGTYGTKKIQKYTDFKEIELTPPTSCATHRRKICLRKQHHSSKVNVRQK